MLCHKVWGFPKSPPFLSSSYTYILCGNFLHVGGVMPNFHFHDAVNDCGELIVYVTL
jgi:hypothetical protein